MTRDEATLEISKGIAFYRTKEAMDKAIKRHEKALARFFPIGGKAVLSHHYTIARKPLEVTVIAYSMPPGDVAVEVPPGSVEEWRLCGSERKHILVPYPALSPPRVFEAEAILKG